jgi:hypothetical protein
MTGMETVNLILGAVGSALGILSAWYLVLDNRVRLGVGMSRRFIVQVGGGAELRRIAFSVVNLSKFPVTIVGVGGRRKDGATAIVIPELLDGGPWPRRLEPREAFSAFVRDNERSAISLFGGIWPSASTACGITRFGKLTRLEVDQDGTGN